MRQQSEVRINVPQIEAVEERPKPSLLEQIIDDATRPEAQLIESILERELRVSAELEAHRRLVATHKRLVGVRREYICRCGRTDPRWFGCAQYTAVLFTSQA